MEKDYEKYVIKAPLEELAKLASNLIRCQIPVTFDGTIRMEIEVWPIWEKPLLTTLAGIRRRCNLNNKVFELEHYPVKIK